jgi:hypothetical protein
MHADNLSHHPDYPNLPLHAPLTYTLAMQACLSPNATERPTFRQLVSLLDDLASEVSSGKYIDSSGKVQVQHAVLCCAVLSAVALTVSTSPITLHQCFSFWFSCVLSCFLGSSRHIGPVQLTY